MLVAAMALSVAACGSSKGNSAKTDGTEAMASSVSKTPDNQISINLASEPQSIDPALNSAVDGGCMIVNSFAGLYTYDKDGKLIPQLASDMPEVSDDETVYMDLTFVDVFDRLGLDAPVNSFRASAYISRMSV